MTKHGMATPKISLPPESNPSAIDFPSGPITCHRLNGKNYLQWSQSVRLFICGRGKDAFLSGESPCPASEDPKSRTWNSENCMVMSWLINSMTTEIGENFLLYRSAKEIWDAARDTYSSKDNTSELFAIECRLQDLRQGESSVTDFFNNLTRLWQQLDLFEVYEWECPADGDLFRGGVEQRRIFRFLSGLNPSLDDVRGRILGTKPLPSLRGVFSVVRHEESRRKIMLTAADLPSSVDASALAAQHRFPPPNDDSTGGMRMNPNLPGTGQFKQSRLWCPKCRKSTHTLDTCWKIHGKPADWKPARQQRANTATVDPPTSEQQPFTKEQLDALQKLFGQPSVTSNPSLSCTGNVAHSGIASFTSSQHDMSSYWIIDSGASDRMTGCLNYLHNFQQCNAPNTVRIANGSLSTVTGCGIGEDDWQC
ncbi:uncharacterized protein [Primulina eburnea]|uniref:uncharacterized protein isoform X1 n=1 Tax=Primulina eburnea TaxID=1245227 RepID=UPI003C6C2C06